MVYGAENALKVMEADPESKQILDAYRDGANSFIQHLHYKTYPLEYKLMGFEPELWNNVKTSLMIKFMADKLSGYTEDFELTLAKKLFGSTFDILYPEHQDEEFVVIPSQSKKSTTTSDSLVSLHNIDTSLPVAAESNDNRDRNEHAGIGSNNWAVSGSKTISGKPMLCNDPHLPLNLPAIWYENQLVTPTMNVYGVSLPGAPHVVIGFNDSIAWGFTNGYRDVKDFYTIQCKNASKKEYWLDGKYEPSTIKIETIKIKGKPDFIDTVAYTKLGIVMYDPSFPHKGYEGQYIAVNWMAHRGSNELKALTKLNQSNNYTDYVNAIMDFHCPHQNIVFASASGDIAMWSQGLIIHKKEQQGRFIEDGTTIQSAWGNVLPASENPHCLNPA
jgi:penicillin amidase